MPDLAQARRPQRSAISVHATVLRYAAVSALADLKATYTWRTWTFGWMVRVLAQVGFFGLIGLLLDDPDRVAYWLLVAIAALVHLSESGRRDGSIEFG